MTDALANTYRKMIDDIINPKPKPRQQVSDEQKLMFADQVINLIRDTDLYRTEEDLVDAILDAAHEHLDLFQIRDKS